MGEADIKNTDLWYGRFIVTTSMIFLIYGTILYHKIWYHYNMISYVIILLMK